MTYADTLGNKVLAPMFIQYIALGLALIVLSGCAAVRTPVPGVVPAGNSPLSGPALGDPFPDYLIGPQDVLNVNVFREPDLSLEEVRIDSSGRFEMPLIGKVDANNKTLDALSAELNQRLGERYLVEPNVTVNLVEVNSKRITLEGEFDSPGVYNLAGKTDLLSAIAIGGGPDEFAKLTQVVVFRKINGQNNLAVFDLSRIRSGEMANPEILPDDIVVIGFSNLRRSFQDFLRAAPILAIFRPFN